MPMTNDLENPNPKGSRRRFLNYTALSAAALTAAQKATAAPAAIRVPDAIPNAIRTPGKPAEFPMRGAQVFAKRCSAAPATTK